MCGIAGIVGANPPPEQVLGGMLQGIRYRGRDDEGTWQERGVTLLHTRLAVIDLETGHQPMRDIGERYVIVFNGEIYNYAELRKEYQSQGATFRTQSDTEVLLEGFRLKGAAVCQDLNGMFAFAIWDREKQELFLARDRLGKKPLFWTYHSGSFLFASTLDAFRAVPGWEPRISRVAVALYEHLGALPGDVTILENAHALPAATWARISVGQSAPATSSYWQLRFGHQRRASLGSHLDEYEAILTDAVRLRLRSDVPIALTFSGGVDSGTIAAICAKRLKAGLRCYTIDYHTEADPSEETRIAERAAGLMGLEWHYIHFDYHKDLLRDLSDSYQHYDQPCQQLALVYSRRLYQAIKPYATVVLSGNGADELFTGYDGDEKVRQRELALAFAAPLRPLFRNWKVLPTYLRNPLPIAFAEMIQRSAALASDDQADGEELARVLGKLATSAMESGAESALDLKMFMGLQFRAADSNFRIPDISGLDAQVEVRSPYLDFRMVEFAARLPHRFKVGRLFSAAGNKYLPKRYYARHVPRDIAWSTKKGMGWNLRWDRSIGTKSEFRNAFLKSFDRLDEHSLKSSGFRSSWRSYLKDIAGGQAYSIHARSMMNGFMLGAWLGRNPG